MSKVYQPCSPFGGDGRTNGLDQLFTAQIAWNISGKWKEQVSYLNVAGYSLNPFTIFGARRSVSNSNFYQIQVCADEQTYTSLWVKYTIRGASIVQRDMTPGRPSFRFPNHFKNSEYTLIDCFLKIYRIDTSLNKRFFGKSTTTGVTKCVNSPNIF